MNNVKLIRQKLGVSQQVLADGIGCSQGNIGHYEIGGQAIPPDAARRLIAFAEARNLVITYDDIYDDPRKLEKAAVKARREAGKPVADDREYVLRSPTQRRQGPRRLLGDRRTGNDQRNEKDAT